MSQNDLVIANQIFPDFRADVTSALQALATNSSGATEPTTRYPFMLWADEATNTLKMRNRANNTWLTLAFLNTSTNRWEVRGDVFQALTTAGISLRNAAGTTRVTIADNGKLTLIANAIDGAAVVDFSATLSGTVKASGGGTDKFLRSDGNWASFKDAVSDMLCGQIAYYAMNTAPPGTLKANGAAVSRTTYARLFAKIGTVHGAGNGSTTFNLPDRRGEFIRGWDDGRGVDAGRAFGSAQTHAVEQHQHLLVSRTDTGGGLYDPAIFAGVSGTTISGAPRNTGGMVTGSVSTETRPRNVADLAVIFF